MQQRSVATPSGSFVMPEPTPTRPLPANRAFVLQLQAGAAESEIRHAGRVEHLTSGEAARFDGEDELWAFVDGVLVEVAESSAAKRR